MSRSSENVAALSEQDLTSPLIEGPDGAEGDPRTDLMSGAESHCRPVCRFRLPDQPPGGADLAGGPDASLEGLGPCEVDARVDDRAEYRKEVDDHLHEDVIPREPEAETEVKKRYEERSLEGREADGHGHHHPGERPAVPQGPRDHLLLHARPPVGRRTAEGVEDPCVGYDDDDDGQGVVDEENEEIVVTTEVEVRPEYIDRAETVGSVGKAYVDAVGEEDREGKGAEEGDYPDG